MQKVLFFLSFISLSMQAQTKMIAYKSHSGNTADFLNSVFKDIFDVNDANFGVAPERFVFNSKLDTVIFIDENKSVIITSKFCHEYISNDTTVWKPGKDTLIDHSVFIISNLDSIKSNLKNYYFFRNNIDSVVFLKYDAKKKSYKNITPKKEKFKTKKSKENKKSKATLFGFLLISGAVGFFGIRRKK